ncbi:MAG: TetR/AcrR family transcriptional regulator [Actinobacteria bacterium]|nr:TetR/AcrR family transcriptional regulator [Actinomycetota bacterium]
MAHVRTPRARWIEEALRTVAAGGPDAVRIEALARDLGVTKGGFYWHFDGRRALLDEMLDTWEHSVVDSVIEHIDAAGGEARAKLARLFALASSSKQLPRIELAIRNWARHDEAVADRLRRVDNRRMDYLRSLFGQFIADDDEVEARCFLVFTVFIGSQFLASDHRGRTRAEVQRIATDLLLDVPTPHESGS